MTATWWGFVLAMLATTAIVTRVYPKVSCSPHHLTSSIPLWKLKSLEKLSPERPLQGMLLKLNKICLCWKWAGFLSLTLSSISSVSSPQRSWMAVCMLTATSSCATQTPSTGETLSNTPGSISWWCPPTAASHVSYQLKSSISASQRWLSGIYQIFFTDWTWVVFFYLTQLLN